MVLHLHQIVSTVQEKKSSIWTRPEQDSRSFFPPLLSGLWTASRPLRLGISFWGVSTLCNHVRATFSFEDPVPLMDTAFRFDEPCIER